MSIVSHPANGAYRSGWDLAFGKKEPEAPSGKRSCNRHDDCDAADARAKEAGHHRADHCHDETCEDCFGS